MYPYCLGMLSVIFVLGLSVHAEIESMIKPLGEYSTSPVILDLVDAPQDATAAYYVRRVDGEKATAWEPIHPDYMKSATQYIYPATHGERLQFRPAVTNGKNANMLTFADFERSGSQLIVDFDSSREMFRCDYYIYSEGHMQGTYGLGIRIKKNHDLEFNDKDLVGFKFSDRIPTRDWTNYRFLELYFWSNFPEDFSLLLQGEKDLITVPLMQFSLDGKQKEKWHYIKIDLDKVFSTPEEHGYMRVCAFTHPIKGLKMNQDYEVRFDAIRLWSDDSFVETQIDATPPTVPLELSHQLKGGLMTWSWKPSDDDESGIVGYSYSWSRSSRDNPPDEIMITDPTVSFPFSKPPIYSDYHFKVKAKNRAGNWSEIAKESVNYNPQNY